MAHITSSCIIEAKASAWSHPSLGNKEVTSTMYPKRSGIRIEVNNPNDKPQPCLLLFIPYCGTIYPASLKIPACSYLRLYSLWQVHLEEMYVDIRLNFLILCISLSTGLSQYLFPGFFRNRTPTYNNLCLQENTKVECELSGQIFSVLVHYKGQGPWSLAGEAGLTTSRMHTYPLWYTNKTQIILSF